ncbi:MAG: hypothetical protein MUE67_01240 [Anaerolineales bacterium]|nr:hypothetical protein [Anaerolineales bacterium]
MDPESAFVLQPALFEVNQTSVGNLELFPKVWRAAEEIVDPFLENRQRGIDTLEEVQAVRFSPLIAYLLFTRITEPDPKLRCRVIRVLSEAISPDAKGNLASDGVWQILRHYLALLGWDQIIPLLEAIEIEPALEKAGAVLLKANSRAGEVLAEIMLDRKNPLSIRVQAAQMIGRVGYLDAVPSIERLMNRLEARVNGQQVFPFSSAESTEEAQLLPVLQAVQAILRAS